MLKKWLLILSFITLFSMEEKKHKPIQVKKNISPTHAITKQNLVKEIIGLLVLASGTYVLMSQTK
jgi:hypothetical protein